MRLESEETSHDESRGYAVRGISEAVLYGDAVPGVFGVAALAAWLQVPQVRLPSRAPAVQRTLSVFPVKTPGVGDGRDGTPREPCAADKMVSGVLSGLPG